MFKMDENRGFSFKRFEDSGFSFIKNYRKFDRCSILKCSCRNSCNDFSLSYIHEKVVNKFGISFNDNLYDLERYKCVSFSDCKSDFNISSFFSERFFYRLSFFDNSVLGSIFKCFNIVNYSKNVVNLLFINSDQLDNSLINIPEEIKELFIIIDLSKIKKPLSFLIKSRLSLRVFLINSLKENCSVRNDGESHINLFLSSYSDLSFKVIDLSNQNNSVNLFLDSYVNLDFLSSVFSDLSVRVNRSVIHFGSNSSSFLESNFVSFGGKISAKSFGMISESVNDVKLVQKNRGFILCKVGRLSVKPAISVKKCSKNDVSHSFSLINFDESRLNYFMSRGLSKRDVKLLFLEKVLSNVIY